MKAGVPRVNIRFTMRHVFRRLKAQISWVLANGEPDWDRTSDPLIKSQMLYH